MESLQIKSFVAKDERRGEKRSMEDKDQSVSAEAGPTLEWAPSVNRAPSDFKGNWASPAVDLVFVDPSQPPGGVSSSLPRRLTLPRTGY